MKSRFIFAALSFLLLLFAAGCVLPSSSRPTSVPPGQTPEAVYTSAVETVVAQLTEAAVTSAPPSAAAPTEALQPTDTPAPTQPPAPPTAAPTQPQPTATQPAPTAAPSATPVSSDPKASLGSPTWQETFVNETNWSFSKDKHSQMGVENDKLVMVAFNADSFDSWALTWPKTNDFYVEMTVTTGKCSGLDRYGLMVRAPSEADRGYLFGVSCDGHYSFRLWNGKKYTRLVDWTASDKILTGKGQTNRIGVKGVGDKYSLYVNGSFLTTVTNDTYEGGHFGVFVAAAQTPDFTATVSEIDYWALP